jgi:hypothetical protein
MRLVDPRTYANIAAAIVASGKGVYRGWAAARSRPERTFDERALQTWLDDGGPPTPDQAPTAERDARH